MSTVTQMLSGAPSVNDVYECGGRTVTFAGGGGLRIAPRNTRGLTSDNGTPDAAPGSDLYEYTESAAQGSDGKLTPIADDGAGHDELEAHDGRETLK